MTFKLPKNHGFTLLENIVAVAILTTIGAAYSITMSSAFRSKAHIQDNVERESLSSFFASSTSCADTLTNGTCNAGSFLNVKRRLTDGTLVTIASRTVGSGTVYGTWTVRGECELGGKGVVLRAVHLAGNGNLNSTADSDFVADALTNKITHWSDDESLLLPIIVYGGSTSGVALCTGGNVMPMRSEGATDVLTDRCTASYTSLNHLCKGSSYKDVTFTQPFNRPPSVVVSIAYVCDEACANRVTESTSAFAESVSRTGFRMNCNGSPPLSLCSDASPTRHCAGHCSWTAIGN